MWKQLYYMMGKRRDRGYLWENSLCKTLNGINGWRAVRLGGTTITMPDILATHESGIVCGIECKSTGGNLTYVPGDQLIRCAKICEMFELYESYSILAFKYMKNNEHKLQKLFFIVNYDVHVGDTVKCRWNTTPEYRRHKHGAWNKLSAQQYRRITFNEKGFTKN